MIGICASFLQVTMKYLRIWEWGYNIEVMTGSFGEFIWPSFWGGLGQKILGIRTNELTTMMIWWKHGDRPSTGRSPAMMQLTGGWVVANQHMICIMINPNPLILNTPIQDPNGMWKFPTSTMVSFRGCLVWTGDGIKQWYIGDWWTKHGMIPNKLTR